MEIEIPFGAFDSELMHQEINIPEGFEAEIKGNKIILKKTESEDEKVRKEILDCFRAMKQQGCFPSKHKEQYDSWLAWLEKKGKHSIYNVPSREVILAIWDLGNEWKELTNGSISTEYGTQLDYIQKHWHESEYYLQEKQGEQNDSDVKDYNSIDPHFGKPIDKVEPKFKVGDWVVWDNKISCHIDNIYQGKESLMYTITDDHNMTRSYSVKGFDNNAHLWTINDARDGDVLTDGGYPCIFKSINEGNSMFVYCGIKGNRNFATKADSEDNIWDDEPENYCPATKEQRDTLFAKMKESGYKWNAEKKELEKIEDEEYNGEDYGIDGLWHAMNILEQTLGSVDGYQSDDGILEHKCAITVVNKLYKQKPDWGEEDERIYQSIIDDTVQENQLDSKQIDWLKSLKGRVQPKQEWSEEDEELVKWSINNLTELKDRFGEKYGKVGKCIDWLKSLIPQNHWKTSKEQMSRLKWIAHQKARRL